MVVYVDILVLTNLYIDFFLLYAVKKFLRLRIKNSRLVIGAFVGSLFSLAALLPPYPRPIALMVSIACALITCACSFLPLKLISYIKASIALWLFSFCLAGFFMAVVFFLAPGNLAVNNGVVYINISPLILFISTALAYLILYSYRRIFPERDSFKDFFYITVVNKNKSVELYAKADTGNALCEPFSGLPVIIAEQEAVADISPAEISAFFKEESSVAVGGIRMIPYETMGTAGVLPAFKPDSVFFSKNKITVDCYLAVTPRALSCGQFNCILNPRNLKYDESRIIP